MNNKGKVDYGDLNYEGRYGQYKISVISDKIEKITNLKNKKFVLEVGSGTGEMALRYSKCVETVICCDYDVKMLIVSKNKFQERHIKKIECIVADAKYLPFKMDVFDIVFERNLPLIYKKEALKQGIAKKVIAEMKRVSKKEVLFMNQKNHVIENRKHQTDHFFNTREFEKMARDNSLSIVKIDYITHSSDILMRIIGVNNLTKLEKIISKTPILRRFSGSIILYAVK